MAKSNRAGESVAAGTDGRPENGGEPPRTLAVDIGGSHTKAAVLDRAGRYMVERVRIPTPVGRAPVDMVATIVDLVGPLPTFERVSVGFPGVVGGGIVRTAPNLDHDGWKGIEGGVAAWHD